MLLALRDRGADPRVAAAARALSWAGEHAALWLVTGVTGAARAHAAGDARLRARRLRGTALVAAAHLTSMAVKRVVRRPRPDLPGRPPLVRTAAAYSFPSSHAASATAAAIAFAPLPGTVSGRPSGARWLPAVAAAMCASRVVAGVHYPTDVAAGALLGALTVRLGRTPRPRGTRDVRPRTPAVARAADRSRRSAVRGRGASGASRGVVRRMTGRGRGRHG
ncbi:phosphatase PAP2 family protein [Streptomyces sp. SAJ15]|uniref:phosphatase PAP2 family protein n=1 Tax=Streptomyces sp. SAJ15 TaxID=2011095 RepID=UPI0021B22F29|nr:phosphatase PAP2 family protein [Streptomyces sp. SAJ15]